MSTESPRPIPPPPPPHSVPQPAANGSSRPRFPIQFSLKTLLWIVTGSAVLLGIVVILPTWIFTILSLWIFVALPAALTTGLIYGRNDLQVFCLGGLFPAGTALLRTVFGTSSGSFDGELAGIVTRAFHPLAGTRSLGNIGNAFALVAEVIPVIVATAMIGYFCIWIRHRIEGRS